MRIPVDIIGGHYSGRSVGNRQECVNMIPCFDDTGAKSPKSLITTPGTALFAELGNTSGRVRGLHEMAGSLYAVHGPNVYKVLSHDNIIAIGQIPDKINPVTMADNGSVLAVCDGDLLYVYENGVMKPVTDASSVTYQDQVFIVSMPGSGEIRHSSLIGTGVTFDPLTFGNAEGDPDNVVRVLSDHRELWAFGTKTCEVFYNSGDAGFLFTRLPGGFIECGCGAKFSPAKADNTIFWLDDKAMVRRADGYNPVIISKDSITAQIKKLGFWSDAEGYTFHMIGHTFYVLTFPYGNLTLVYDVSSGQWFKWSSGHVEGRHAISGYAFCYQRDFIGDSKSGKLFELSMDYKTDNGEMIKRIRTSQPVNKPQGNKLVYHSFELSCEVGEGINAPTFKTDLVICKGGSGDIQVPILSDDPPIVPIDPITLIPHIVSVTMDCLTLTIVFDCAITIGSQSGVILYETYGGINVMMSTLSVSSEKVLTANFLDFVVHPPSISDYLLSYTQPGGGIASVDGVELASFSNLLVANTCWGV